jgi:chaperonin GroES
MSKFTPIHDNVLVKKTKMPESESKAVRPNSSEDQLACGIIRAIGDYGKLTSTGLEMPSLVEVGDTIIFNELRGQNVFLGGEELIVIKEDWILLKVE